MRSSKSRNFSFDHIPSFVYRFNRVVFRDIETVHAIFNEMEKISYENGSCAVFLIPKGEHAFYVLVNDEAYVYDGIKLILCGRYDRYGNNDMLQCLIQFVEAYNKRDMFIYALYDVYDVQDVDLEEVPRWPYLY